MRPRPVRFDPRDQHLYLWNGHRFHEQPSRSFIAGDRVPTEKLALEIPRLPARLEGAFTYCPDHVALTAVGLPGKPRLKIDFPLWRTLRRLARGLPRKLIPERDIHRLDAFLEKLGAGVNGGRDTIWSVHLENFDVIQVNLSIESCWFEGVGPMRKPLRTQAERLAEAAAERRVHGANWDISRCG